MGWLITAYAWTRTRIIWVMGVALAVCLLAISLMRNRLKEREREAMRAHGWIDTAKRISQVDESESVEQARERLKEIQDEMDARD